MSLCTMNPHRRTIQPEAGNPPPFDDDEVKGSKQRPLSVVVIGGSVAETLATLSRNSLLSTLTSSKAFEGREIQLSCLAIRGMKQPQQLMIIDWFESLGARIDVLINLDGYNEMLIGRENSLQGTFPFYPRLWTMRLEGIQQPKLLAHAGKLFYLEELRTGLASFVAESPIRLSVVANVAWELLDRSLEFQIVTGRGELNKDLLAREATASMYDASGPGRKYENARALYLDLANYWKHTSILLQNKAEAYGFRYFHFLQPNQHVPDSKPMGPKERAIALPASHVNKRHVTEAYRHLIQSGKQMAAVGVPFTDLTMLFQDVEEPVYVDACCHFNGRGDRLIAEEIARVIARSTAGFPSQTP